MDKEYSVKIGDDGELISEESPKQEPEIEPEKRKIDEFNTPAIKLWNRPFPDIGGYDSAELFLDPDLRGTWMFTVVLRWAGEPDSNNKRHLYQKMLYGRDFADRESASRAGIESYRQWIEQVVSIRNTPHPFDWKAFFPLWGIFFFLLEIAGWAVYLLFLRNQEGDQAALRLLFAFAPLGLSCLLSAFLASTQPDPRL